MEFARPSPQEQGPGAARRAAQTGCDRVSGRLCGRMCAGQHGQPGGTLMAPLMAPPLTAWHSYASRLRNNHGFAGTASLPRALIQPGSGRAGPRSRHQARGLQRREPACRDAPCRSLELVAPSCLTFLSTTFLCRTSHQLAGHSLALLRALRVMGAGQLVGLTTGARGR